MCVCVCVCACVCAFVCVCVCVCAFVCVCSPVMQHSVPPTVKTKRSHVCLPCMLVSLTSTGTMPFFFHWKVSLYAIFIDFSTFFLALFGFSFFSGLQNLHMKLSFSRLSKPHLKLGRGKRDKKRQRMTTKNCLFLTKISKV